jgi:hypothetical protein
MKCTQRIGDSIASLKLQEGTLTMEFCPSPLGIERYFTEEVRLASFPPNGIAGVCELDSFFLIKRGTEVVGYFKAVDMFFDGVIELHGSYNGPTDFLVKRYFFLSRKFAQTIQKMFPKKQIRTFVKKDNTKILPLLNWLQFERLDDASNLSEYIQYVYTDTSMLSWWDKILHSIYCN